MPEEKITRQKIRDHFRRLWIAYLAGIAIVLFLNNLVFTVTRPSFSDDETLKIMLLNVQADFDEAELLKEVESLGFRAVETVELSVSPEDSTSRMLLVTQLVAGYGDIYITDAAGLSVLENQQVCHTVRQLPEEKHMVVISNGTDIQSALGALEILDEKLGV